MKLETYLDAMCIAHFRMVEADLDQEALPGRENLYPRSERQYTKFRQRILDKYNNSFLDIYKSIPEWLRGTK